MVPKLFWLALLAMVCTIRFPSATALVAPGNPTTQVYEQLDTAVQSNDSAGFAQVMQTIRQGLGQLTAAQTKFLNQFDLVNNRQRCAELAVCLVQQAYQYPQSVAQVVNAVLAKGCN